MRFIVTAIFPLAICAAASLAQSLIPSNEDSRVEFKIKNFGSTVEGSFKGVQGMILFDPTALSTARFDVSIEANTIDTGIDMRDNHLRKDTYFDVACNPEKQTDKKIKTW